MSKKRKRESTGSGAPPANARPVASRKPRVGWIVAILAIAYNGSALIH